MRIAAGTLVVAAGAGAVYGVFKGAEKGVEELAAIPGKIVEAIPDIDIELPEAIYVGPEPATAIAAVDHETYKNESDLDLSCYKQVEVGVDVIGGRKGSVWFGIYNRGNAELFKKTYGDFLLCGDNDELNQNISTNETVDPITGEVISVEITVPGLNVTHPRVDHLAPKNCVDGNPGDTPEEIDAKLAQYLADVAAGEGPNCDDGFEVTGTIDRFASAPDDSAELINLGHAAAQLAMVFDANPIEIIEEADQEWGQEILDELASQNRYQNADIDVIVERRSGVETIQKRLDEIAADLMARFSVVLVAKQGETLILHVEDSSGSWVNVPLTSYAELTVDEANLVLEKIGTTNE